MVATKHRIMKRNGRIVKLDTGIYVYSYLNDKGARCYKTLTKDQYNLQYKMNTWWSKVKYNLNKLGINVINKKTSRE